ncbi:unnamed protein product [Nesidiocoris tenuis]|uniref:Uncharacterized protein n=1 Tax=Nesidiocoris tenuis TaxID=355587 RepID=A0A6H5GGP7_9HEMI|nr:unnamed protein product [Nesidiocoris tenuis]
MDRRFFDKLAFKPGDVSTARLKAASSRACPPTTLWSRGWTLDRLLLLPRSHPLDALVDVRDGVPRRHRLVAFRAERPCLSCPDRILVSRICPSTAIYEQTSGMLRSVAFRWILRRNFSRVDIFQGSSGVELTKSCGSIPLKAHSTWPRAAEENFGNHFRSNFSEFLGSWNVQRNTSPSARTRVAYVTAFPQARLPTSVGSHRQILEMIRRRNCKSAKANVLNCG